jgi:4-hydroxy-tetrahydrodipicolinate synthase
MMAERFAGVFPVVLTPFDSNDAVDVPALRRYLRYLLDRRVHGLAAMGSTSELQQLRGPEWTIAVQTIVEESAGRVPVVVGCSANATRDVLARAREAQELGADAIMVTPPFYCLPRPHELLNHYVVIADSVDLPIMMYNNPFTTGVDLTPIMLAKLSDHPHLCLLKESSGQLNRVSQIIELSEGKIRVFSGYDDLTLESYLQGAMGCISAAANIIPEAMVEVFHHVVETNDLRSGLSLWGELREFMTFIDSSSMYVQLTKAGVRCRDIDCGDPRLPLLPANDEQIQTIDKFLAKHKLSQSQIFVDANREEIGISA